MEVYVLHRYLREINSDSFEGVFVKSEDVVKYILGFYDYLVFDTREYGDDEEADILDKNLNEARNHWRHWREHGAKNFKVNQSHFAYDFTVTKTEIIEY